MSLGLHLFVFWVYQIQHVQKITRVTCVRAALKERDMKSFVLAVILSLVSVAAFGADSFSFSSEPFITATGSASCSSNGTCAASARQPVRNVVRAGARVGVAVARKTGEVVRRVVTLPVRAVRAVRSARGARCGACCCR